MGRVHQTSQLKIPQSHLLDHGVRRHAIASVKRACLLGPRHRAGSRQHQYRHLCLRQRLIAVRGSNQTTIRWQRPPLRHTLRLSHGDGHGSNRSTFQWQHLSHGAGHGSNHSTTTRQRHRTTIPGRSTLPPCSRSPRRRWMAAHHRIMTCALPAALHRGSIAVIFAALPQRRYVTVRTR